MFWKIGAPRSFGTFAFSFGLALLLVLGAFRVLPHASTEEGRLRLRYEELRMALNSGNPSRTAFVLPPGFSRDRSGTLSRLETFARPLHAGSKFSFDGNTVDICPNPQSHFVVIPGGDSVEMVRMGGQWYFSGVVHID